MESLSFSYFDLILGIPLLFAVYKGVSKGFLYQAVSLVALIGGIYGAYHFSGFAKGILIEQMGIQSEYTGYIATAITFLVIVLAVHLIGKFLDKIITAVSLGFFNRIAGLIFSVAKTALILSVLLLIIDGMNEKSGFLPEEPRNSSILYSPLVQTGQTVLEITGFEDLFDQIPELEDTQV